MVPALLKKSSYAYILKNKKKLYLLSKFYKNNKNFKNNFEYLDLIIIKFFLKNKPKPQLKTKIKTANTVFYFIKNLLMYYLWLLKLNKNFKFNKKLNNLTYKFNFNNLKNKKKIINKKIINKKIINKEPALKKAKKPQKIKIFNSFMFSYLIKEKYNVLNFNKRKMYVFLQVFNSIINIFSNIFYVNN